MPLNSLLIALTALAAAPLWAQSPAPGAAKPAKPAKSAVASSAKPTPASLPPELAQALPLVSVSEPIFRFEDELSHLKLAVDGLRLAYISAGGRGGGEELRMLELTNRRIYRISAQRVGAGFLWDPFGDRLLYRTIEASSDGKLSSTLYTYDASLHKSVAIKSLPESSGYPTLNPRDLRLYTLSAQGLMITKLAYPDNRLARWQESERQSSGNWLVTQQRVLWAAFGGLEIHRLSDDGSGIASYAISPDGQLIAWATQAGRMYVSRSGRASTDLGGGRDPDWHPSKKLLLYAGGRMVGQTAASYDLRVVNEQGEGRWLTYTQHSNERWPQWHPSGRSIYYTAEQTTDLYALDLQDAPTPTAKIATKP